MTQDYGQAVIIAGMLINIIMTIWGFRKAQHENEKLEKEKYLFQAKLEEIIEKKTDIDSISAMQVDIGKIKRKLDHDWTVQLDHKETLKDHEESMVQLKQESTLILRALLNVMLSLKEQGINHTTDESIEEIKRYLTER